MKTTLRSTILEMTSVSELNEVIKLCNEVKKMNAKTSLTVGQKVYVVHAQNHNKRTLGTLKAIKVSRATVELPEGTYSVPLTMLEAAHTGTYKEIA